MISFEYKMLQVSSTVVARTFQESEDAAAIYLEQIINRWARRGWEFYRMDTMQIAVLPGCLGRLLGARNEYFPEYVITLRRPSED